MEMIGIVHYDDIALKGANRDRFERALARAIAENLSFRGYPMTVENRWGRITIRPHDAPTPWPDDMRTAVADVLAHTPGVAVYGIGYRVQPTLEQMEEQAAAYAQELAGTFTTFRVTARRLDKAFPHTSHDIEVALGEAVRLSLGDSARVQLTNSDLTLCVDVFHNEVHLYAKHRGVSGLPVGSVGAGVALLSGGFDSPVAAWMCATRGVTPMLMHFHAYPQTSDAAREKVRSIANVLRTSCGPLTLAMVPFLEAQKAIAFAAPEKLRVILYRRAMMRVAEKWAQAHGAAALITGESVGQVASQTLENIGAIEDATSLPVLRPLAGMHKNEIIARAKHIGTHDISLQRHDDTCTLFMPRKPATSAYLADVHAAERAYDSNALTRDMFARIELERF